MAPIRASGLLRRLSPLENGFVWPFAMSSLSDEIAGLEQSIREKFEQYQKLKEERNTNKTKIKEWNTGFTAREGRAPTNDDKAAIRPLYIAHKKHETGLKSLKAALTKLKEELEVKKGKHSAAGQVQPEAITRRETDDADADHDRRLEEKVRARIRKIFTEMDLNHDGNITHDEQQEFYKKSGANLDDPKMKARMDAAWAKVDVNHDGSISMAEFEELQLPLMLKAVHKRQASRKG
jgi:hypothetical protein